MSAALFDAYTTHCFFHCDHIVVDVDPVKSNDTMERHYWDNHYTQQDRDTLRGAGQPASRIGVKP